MHLKLLNEPFKVYIYEHIRSREPYDQCKMIEIESRNVYSQIICYGG